MHAVHGDRGRGGQRPRRLARNDAPALRVAKHHRVEKDRVVGEAPELSGKIRLGNAALDGNLEARPQRFEAAGGLRGGRDLPLAGPADDEDPAGVRLKRPGEVDRLGEVLVVDDARDPGRSSPAVEELRVHHREHDRGVGPELIPVSNENVQGHVGQREDEGGLALGVLPAQEWHELAFVLLAAEPVRVEALGVELDRPESRVPEQLANYPVHDLARREHDLGSGQDDDAQRLFRGRGLVRSRGENEGEREAQREEEKVPGGGCGRRGFHRGLGGLAPDAISSQWARDREAG